MVPPKTIIKHAKKTQSQAMNWLNEQESMSNRNVDIIILLIP